ncbi:histidine phosphatase family protein [Streptomyces eurythermus]|uniref:histidine phosphatase family protein n=1 Tax=Streptomyces eurythermus TaxID=42237 RepID=UPI003409FEF6
MIRLFLVRHGENPANVHHILSFRRADFRLTSRGIRQAEALAPLLRRPGRGPDTAWWSSPLRRARHTAEVLAPPGTGIRVLEGLRELDVGELDGSGRPDDRDAYEKVIAAWRLGEETARFPGGESLAEAVERFETSLRAIADDRAEGSAAVVVGHGGLFTEALTVLLPPADRALFERAHRPRWLNCEAAELTARTDRDGRLRLRWAGWLSAARPAAGATP